jgi:thiol-disulfide isomerase/thioredoxin
VKKILLYLVVGIISLSLGIAYQLNNRYDFTTFAEWCAPCLREIPELNEFKKLTDGKQNGVLFGISYDAMQDHELALLTEKYNIEFPLINNIETALPFETPKYLPATYLIRPDGTLAGQLLGEQNSKSLSEAISGN